MLEGITRSLCMKCVLTDLTFLQPLYKSQQRLLLNLCAHAETRVELLKILMDLLMLDKKKSLADLNAAEPPYRLYACQSHVMYSRPQYVDGKYNFQFNHFCNCIKSIAGERSSWDEHSVNLVNPVTSVRNKILHIFIVLSFFSFFNIIQFRIISNSKSYDTFC